MTQMIRIYADFLKKLLCYDVIRCIEKKNTEDRSQNNITSVLICVDL